MITTKIEVPPHLKEYLIGKFCNMQDSPIRFRIIRISTTLSTTYLNDVHATSLIMEI